MENIGLGNDGSVCVEPVMIMVIVTFWIFLPAPVSNLCGLSVHLGLASFF